MKLSLFSVSYAGFWGQDRVDLDEFPRLAAGLGYSAVMLMGKRPHLSPLDATADHLGKLRDNLRETGLECAAIGGYTDFAGGSAAEVPYLEMQIEYEAFFTGLREGGFDGLATYEMCSPFRGGGGRKNLDFCAAAYVYWMREHGFADVASK